MRAILLAAILWASPTDALSPVVLVPGLYSTRLFAKISANENRSAWCTGVGIETYWERHNRFQMWFSAHTALGAPCFNYNSAVRFDDQHGYRNNSGVEVWVEEFGGLHSISSLSDEYGVTIFGDMIKSLKNLSYTEHENLHGAPYDWRMAGRIFEQPGAFYAQMRTLLEETVRRNGKPAILVAHSMGCASMLDFLVRYIPSVAPVGWKEQHIEKFVALAPVWGGSVKLWENYASSSRVVPQLYKHVFRRGSITMPVGAWLGPLPEVWGNRVIITAGQKNYTAGDALELLADIGLKPAAAMVQDMKQHRATLSDIQKHPGVETHVLYGTDVPTPTRLTYFSEFVGRGEAFPTPEYQYGMGDGSVNDFAVEAFKLWGPAKNGKTVQGYKYYGIQHQAFLTDATIMEKVLSLLGTSGGADRLVVV